MIMNQELLQCFLSEDVLSNGVGLFGVCVLIENRQNKKNVVALFHWQCEPFCDTLPNLFDPTSRHSGAAK